MSVILFVVGPSFTTILSINVLGSSLEAVNTTGTFTSVWSVSPRSIVNVHTVPPLLASAFLTIYFDFLSIIVKLPRVNSENFVP